MKPVIRKIGLSLLILAGVFSGFMGGRWAGRLQSSLNAEANYPWDLHKKIGAIDINCKKLVSAPRTGNFIVEAIDAGNTLIVISFNRSDSRVTASILDSRGRYAIDSWTLECN